MSIDYGQIAIDAARHCREQPEDNQISPQEAWESRIDDTESSDEAAKCAFMRLCADGCVQGIPPSNFQSLHHECSDHGTGVRQALGCLRCCPSLANDKQGLFNAETVENYLHSADSGELDVLIALWNSGDIKTQSPEQ